jgi:hypothetical protein
MRIESGSNRAAGDGFLPSANRIPSTNGMHIVKEVVFDDYCEESPVVRP